MLYWIANVIRDNYPWLWNSLGRALSWLFGLRYGKKMRMISNILRHYSQAEYVFEKLDKENASALAKMFSEQPKEVFQYFHPHGFSIHDLVKLVQDKGFLAYVVKHDKQVVGYFFQRSYFWGNAYRGYITDFRWRRRGINQMMNSCATEIASFLGLKVFGTISPENMASMKSVERVNGVKIIERLNNGDYYVQYLPLKKISNDDSKVYL